MENRAKLSIKISDFGFSTHFKPSEKENRTVGTPFYMAPEVVKKQPYDQKVDVWSAGIIVYYLFAGEVPFLTAN